MNKTCKVCGMTKDIIEFYRNGKNSTCKVCENARNRLYTDIAYEKLKNKIVGYYVYRLIHNNEIIYIGKSEYLGVRLHQHSRDKVFDRVDIIQFDSRPNMHLAEVYFINRYKPKLNKEYLYPNEEVMHIPMFDNMLWKELSDISKKGDTSKKVKVLNKVSEPKKVVAPVVEIPIKDDTPKKLVAQSTGLPIQVDIMEDTIATCFIRKRSTNNIVYIEYSNGKQKNVGSFKSKSEANRLIKNIKFYKDKLNNMYLNKSK